LLGDEKSGWPLLPVGDERSLPVEEAGTNSILVYVVSYISDVSCHGEPKKSQFVNQSKKFWHLLYLPAEHWQT
jgi:hypothetical protein